MDDPGRIETIRCCDAVDHGLRATASTTSRSLRRLSTAERGFHPPSIPPLSLTPSTPILSHEKLFLILSKAAIESGWVEYEIERAHSREHKTGETVLFPVRVDDAIFDVKATWADFIREERHIGDFTDPGCYRDSFERLVGDLSSAGVP